MMKSMTGFGRSSNRTTGAGTATSASGAAHSSEIDISIRAVNGRFLDMRFHLPREYSGLESEFKAQLTKIFSRGTIDIYVNRTSTAKHASVVANKELAQEWLLAYQKLGQDLKLPAEASLDWVAKIPDVMVVRESGDLTDEEAADAKSLLQKAAEACDRERAREGDALRLELERQCAALEALSQSIEGLKLEANTELEKRYRERLANGLQKFGAAGQIDEQRIAQEIVIQLDRADISEEIQRLTEHIKAYRQLLKSPEPQGKKLDFYAQELLREVNTIGSKSHIAKLTSLVVDAKTIVERIREQVQNCE